MIDKSREEQIIRWAKFVRENPIEIWKPMVKEFIDSQFIMAERFYKNLAKTKGGKDKVRRLIMRKWK